PSRESASAASNARSARRFGRRPTDCSGSGDWRAAVMMLARLRRWSELVTFSHTLFAMPFAASAVVLASKQPHLALTPLRVLAMLVCMVTARTSAMAFNRWADRDVDARNPRTMGRPVPSGRTSAREALLLALGSGVAFCAIAATLGFWPAVL